MNRRGFLTLSALTITGCLHDNDDLKSNENNEDNNTSNEVEPQPSFYLMVIRLEEPPEGNATEINRDAEEPELFIELLREAHRNNETIERTGTFSEEKHRRLSNEIREEFGSGPYKYRGQYYTHIFVGQ